MSLGEHKDKTLLLDSGSSDVVLWRCMTEDTMNISQIYSWRQLESHTGDRVDFDSSASNSAPLLCQQAQNPNICLNSNFTREHEEYKLNFDCLENDVCVHGNSFALESMV